ncbi:dolichyl-phosphate beta-glucosyltransferase [Desulfofundulus thermosubterraneus DSM 16057]|uniref:dolichyl-phosphate beta-glucosyltransferase n=1 Tax=Desulfofundulus thermosubterraneus DSM 16057 TaxID=1121432 RepID=A0A1M6D7Y5_9FIRM|nr:dolichyl-phosphate beta-glucosyltransferase [Desulfofundulus thermosubterraneus DSM 16057]
MIIPAYNEECRLGATLKKVISYLKREFTSYEVIVVDDGSSDGTHRVATSFAATNPFVRCLRNHSNRGKGYSVRRGILESRGEWVLFTDADLSTPIEELPHLLEWGAKGYQVVVGSRAREGSRILVSQPFYRVVLGKGFNLAVQLLAVPGVRDTQCGFKLFWGDTARLLASLQVLNRYSFDVELLFLARKLGLPLAEVPVEWSHSQSSRVRPLRDGLRMLADLFFIRWLDLRGAYMAGTAPGKTGVRPAPVCPSQDAASPSD